MFTQRHSAHRITVFVLESWISIFLLRNNVFISLQSTHPYLIRCEQNESCDGCKTSCFNYSVLISPPMKHWLYNFSPPGNSMKIYQSFVSCMVDIQVHNNWSIELYFHPSHAHFCLCHIQYAVCSAYETAQMSVSCKVEHKVLLSTKFFPTVNVRQQTFKDILKSPQIIFLHCAERIPKHVFFFVCLCIVNIIRMWTSLLFMGSGGKIKSFCWKIPRQVMHNVLAAYAAALTAGTQPEFAQITAWLHVMNTIL